MPAIIKPVDAKLEYGFDYIDWLPAGDVITASSWVVPDSLTEHSVSHTDTVTVVEISGGVAGESYELINTITTASGLSDSRCLTIITGKRRPF